MTLTCAIETIRQRMRVRSFTWSKAAKLKDRWSGNELRHSYASARLAVTKNAALVAEELGNSVAIVRAHYAEVLTPGDGAAYFAVKPGKAKNIVRFAA